MRDLLGALGRRYADGVPFGLARVVAVGGSAPRGPGAAPVVGPDDEVLGSVSGGRVEGAVFELAKEVPRPEVRRPAAPGGTAPAAGVHRCDGQPPYPRRPGERLVEAGLMEVELSRPRSPVGRDLGARTPEAVAVSVAAEIVALRWGGSGEPLAGRAGAIHSTVPELS